MVTSDKRIARVSALAGLLVVPLVLLVLLVTGEESPGPSDDLWAASCDASALADGDHSLKVEAAGADGRSDAEEIVFVVNQAGTYTPCQATVSDAGPGGGQKKPTEPKPPKDAPKPEAAPAAPPVQADGNSAVLDLDPQKTYAVIAGVLKWPNNALSPFKKTDRKDLGLYAVLVLRGVPKENLTLLIDRQATKPNILKAIGSQAQQAPPGSLFIFYYAGHGGKSDTGVVNFYGYDYVPENSLSWVTMQDIAAAVKDDFKGRRVLFMADCCYSGGLGQAAQELAKSGYETASLTSADASNISSGNWTFTQTVIEGLRGDPLLDLNNDGVISLQEIGDDVRASMKYREDQLYGYSCNGLKDDFRLVPVNTLTPRRSMPPGGKFALKEFVHAPDDGHQGVGRILGRSQGRYTVEFMDYSAKRMSEVDEANLEKIQFKRYPVGRDVMVLSDGALYPAKILKVEGDFHWITYPGWPSYWDEWVLSTRIIDEPPGGEKAKTRVMVKSEGQWWPAEVLKSDGKKSYIHYLGYDDSWNEWVEENKIKPIKKTP